MLLIVIKKNINYELLEKLNKKRKVNWNILVTSGKEIKRDSISNVNENRRSLLIISKMDKKLFENWGEPSSKAKYNT